MAFFGVHPRYNPPSIQDFIEDFMASTYVFEQAVGDMLTEMDQYFDIPASWAPDLLLDYAMDNVMSADMNSERADTWKRSQEIAELEYQVPYGYDKYEGFFGDITARDNNQGLRDLPKNSRPSMDRNLDQTQWVGSHNHWTSDNQLDTIGRIRKLREITKASVIDGAFFVNVDQEMFSILNYSLAKGDLPIVINGVGSWFILQKADNKAPFREFFKQHYYPELDFFTILAVLRRADRTEDQQTIEDVKAVRKDKKKIDKYRLTGRLD